METSASGEGDLTCRIHAILSFTTEAKLLFSVIPMCLQDLEEQVPSRFSDNSMPSSIFAVYKGQRDEGRGKVAKAILGVAEEGDSIGIGPGFHRWHSGGGGCPAMDIGVYKEATVQAYRAV